MRYAHEYEENKEKKINYIFILTTGLKRFLIFDQMNMEYSFLFYHWLLLLSSNAY